MKFGVIVFPGSNCDMDMIYVLNSILKKKVIPLWHKDTDLQECDFIILPGGFSFGDYLRSGAIAKFSPIMKEILGFANAGGYVMGICNGFQILCETGLLPGTLLHNTNHKFICKNVYLKTISENTIVTNMIGSKSVKIPIAHGEGRYFANHKTIAVLEKNDQILFKYCAQNGKITENFQEATICIDHGFGDFFIKYRKDTRDTINKLLNILMKIDTGTQSLSEIEKDEENFSLSETA